MEKNSIDVEHSARKRGSPPPKTSLKRPARIPIPKTTSRCQSRGKRVKFAGSTSICESGGGLNILLLENKVDGAKTSEYKAFKGLLEKNVYKHNCDEIAKSKINLKTGKTRDCLECLSNAITSKSDVSRLLSPIQNVSSVVQGSLSSPAQILHKHGDHVFIDKNKGKGKIGATRSVQFSKTTPTAPPFHPSPLKIRKSCGEHSRQRHEHEGTFSEKRENLLQLAAMTCSQNVDDFFSNRSDFIIEFLQRLGIRRKSSKHDRLQKFKLTTGAHQISRSSKRSNNILDLYKNSEENSCAFKRGQDDNYSTECKLWKSDLNENSASFLHDFHKSAASAIDLSENCYCNKYGDCTLSKAYALLNSPCEFDEVNACRPNYSVYMGHLNKCLHINSASKHKSDPKVNSKAEVDYSNYGCHECIIPNSYNSEIYFQRQALVPYINEFSTGSYVQSPGLHLELTKDQINFPLLEWDATVEQGPPAPKFLVPKEVNHFPATLCDTPDIQLNFPQLEWDVTAEQELTTPKFLVPAALYDTPEFHNVYGRRGFNDGMRENATHDQTVLDGIIYATSTPVPVSLLKLKSLHNCSDSIEDSSIYSEHPFCMVRPSEGLGWFLPGNRHSCGEDDINCISYPENKFGFTESPSWDVVTFSGMKNFTSLSDRASWNWPGRD